LHRGVGEWLGDPQEAYDYICENLRKGKQVGIPDIFFLQDEKLFLVYIMDLGRV
jgi:hypothetical protein